MADYLVTDTELASIANAIRAKSGENSQIEFPTDFVSKIQDLHVLDTSDATATASLIWSGYTAYVNGNKITGTLDMNDLLTVEPKEFTFEKILSSSITINQGSQAYVDIPCDLSGTGVIIGGNLAVGVGSVTTDVQNFYSNFSITAKQWRSGSGGSYFVRLTVKNTSTVSRSLSSGCYFRVAVTLPVSSFAETETE